MSLPKDQLGFKLKRICDEVERSANQESAALGLTFVQGRTLLYLYEVGGSCGQCDLEHYLGISHPAVGGLLRRMEAKKLLRCAFDARDKRVKNVYITPEGERLYPQVLAIRQGDDEKLTGCLSEEELGELYTLLDRVYNNLK